MDEFLDDMDDEQVDDLLMPEEDGTSSNQMYEHFRFVADKGQSLLRVDKFLVDRMMGATQNIYTPGRAFPRCAPKRQCS